MIYVRFFIHTISKEKEKILNNWSYKYLKKNGYYCIETRIDEDKTIIKQSKKKIKSNIYEFEKGHYRRLINVQEFMNIILKIGFKIKYYKISNNFSKMKLINNYDNPILMRIILQK